METVSNPSINQFLSVKENDCVSPEAIVTASGPLVLCTSGQTLTLTAPAGFNYLWSDSTTAQSITITQTGEYNVTISQPGNNCSATSATLVVIPSPDQTPAITALGETVFCNGGSVQIQGPVGFSSYLWSNGDTTQTATVTTNGPVTLTIQGICQSFTSDPINVTVNTVTDPAANDVTLSAAGSATLTATIGNNISWYATNAGGTPLATGQSYTTPFLTANTTYYMQATDTFGGGIYAVGLPTWSGAGSGYSGSTTNATTEFDVTKNCTLKSVKVFTNAAGIRRIELKDASSNVINYVDVNVSPDSQVVTLNFPLTPGMGYTLGTNTTTNQNNLGTTSPKFKRNSSGVNYPYSLSDALNITNSSNGGQYFYYFYDWQVEKESWLCESNMVPVNVYITTGISEHNNELLSTYPNPVSDQLHIYNPFGTTKATLLDITARVVNTYMLNNGENSFDIASLNAGVYHIQVENEGVITNLKFVKN